MPNLVRFVSKRVFNTRVNTSLKGFSMSTATLPPFEELDESVRSAFSNPRVGYRAHNVLGVCYFNSAVMQLMAIPELRRAAYDSMREQHPDSYLLNLAFSLIPEDQRRLLEKPSKELVELMATNIDSKTEIEQMAILRHITMCAVVRTMIHIATNTCGIPSTENALNYLMQSVYSAHCIRSLVGGLTRHILNVVLKDSCQDDYHWNLSPKRYKTLLFTSSNVVMNLGVPLDVLDGYTLTSASINPIVTHEAACVRYGGVGSPFRYIDDNLPDISEMFETWIQAISTLCLHGARVQSCIYTTNDTEKSIPIDRFFVVEAANLPEALLRLTRPFQIQKNNLTKVALRVLGERSDQVPTKTLHLALIALFSCLEGIETSPVDLELAKIHENHMYLMALLCIALLYPATRIREYKDHWPIQAKFLHFLLEGGLLDHSLPCSPGTRPLGLSAALSKRCGDYIPWRKT